ncbi:MAG TPA: hypothetical protein VMF13_14530, partial [Luteitalea sp.]|nr:hypothetical protein [Luteitalea sp.]
GYQGGFLGVVGDSRDLAEGESLHVGHAVVQAAIDAVRRPDTVQGRVVFALDASAPAEAQPLAGRRGRMAVTRVAHRGIERVDSILTTACLDGEVDPLPQAAVDALLSLPVSSESGPEGTSAAQLLEDAVDAAVFADQSAVSAHDHARFEQMLRQLDHYLADQVLVLRRKEARLESQLGELEQRRGRTLSVQTGADVDERTARLLRERNDLRAQVAYLEEGGDDEYRTWRERLMERRYRRPEVTRLLDVEFEVAGGAGC